MALECVFVSIPEPFLSQKFMGTLITIVHTGESDFIRGVKHIRLKAGKVVTLSASNFMDYLAGSMQARES